MTRSLLWGFATYWHRHRGGSAYSPILYGQTIRTGPGGATYRAGPSRMFTLPDGSTVQIGSLAETQPTVQDLFLNPFNKWSAHHRPIGAGAQKGIPGTTGTASRGRIGNMASVRSHTGIRANRRPVTASHAPCDAALRLS